MKKSIFLMSALLVASFGFIACGDDSDKKDDDSCTTPGAQECDGDLIVTCGEDGKWSDPKPCDANDASIKCSNDVCPKAEDKGEEGDGCTEGQKKCDGDNIKTCGADGKWGNAVACENGKACANDACPADDAGNNQNVYYVYQTTKRAKCNSECGTGSSCIDEAMGEWENMKPSAPVYYYLENQKDKEGLAEDQLSVYDALRGKTATVDKCNVGDASKFECIGDDDGSDYLLEKTCEPLGVPKATCEQKPAECNESVAHFCFMGYEFEIECDKFGKSCDSGDCI